MGELVVREATVLTDGAWVVRDLVCRDGVIAPGEPSDGADRLDGSGLLAVPGFVDVQCNGGYGIDLASEPERLWELGARLPRSGVTAWLPTIVSSPPGTIERALAALAAGPPPGWVGAVPLGLHLEGPFLAPSRRGAHPEGLLRPPSADEVAGWTCASGVAMVTLAPELEAATAVIEALVAGGVVVSLGHSDATADQVTAAVDAGATGVTHLFNAMAPLHHRAPGLAGVALADDRLHVGLIADGIHVDRTVVRAAQRALGDRLVLVTDAVAAMGMPTGRHALGDARVVVGEDGVRLPDGTLAGSDLTMDRAVRNLVDLTGCPPATALSAAAAAPARLLDDPSRGVLEPGARADVVLLTPGLEVAHVFIAGQPSAT
ncbi:MAG: N-acetylglucosamine-6-phosphate deacetylase [Acidimicrobiales bacterium]